MKFQVRAVEDLDSPEFENSLSPENFAFLQSVGKEFLKMSYRAQGFPEVRLRLVPAQPAPLTNATAPKG